MFKKIGFIVLMAGTVLMTGCSDSRSDAAYVAEEMCKATKELNFEKMKEISSEGYGKELSKIEREVQKNEYARKSVEELVSTLNCDEFVQKHGKHNEVFKFKTANRNLNVNVFKPEGEDIYYVRTMI